MRFNGKCCSYGNPASRYAKCVSAVISNGGAGVRCLQRRGRACYGTSITESDSITVARS